MYRLSHYKTMKADRALVYFGFIIELRKSSKIRLIVKYQFRFDHASTMEAPGRSQINLEKVFIKSKFAAEVILRLL